MVETWRVDAEPALRMCEKRPGEVCDSEILSTSRGPIEELWLRQGEQFLC